MTHAGLSKADLKVGLYRLCIVALLSLLGTSTAHAEDGYELWLRYHRVSVPALLKQYRSAITGLLVSGDDWRVIRRRQTIDDLVALEA